LTVTEPVGETAEGLWPYLGVGCITIFAGFFGGGMIAVLLGKVVGLMRSCPPDSETGAPCDWFTYMVVGACVGAVFLPAIALWRMRRGRMKQRNKA
jgi:hypothetical protein